jgi:DUF4097 and DUF4098 domain-containing protein YvlB
MKTAGPVEVRSTFGGVELTGMQLGARVYSGNAPVTITDAGGEAWVENSFGLVSIQRAAGAVTVVNQNGAVRIEGARAGVNAKTSFGQLEVQGAGGPVDLTANNGSITLIGLPAKCVPVAARASFGAIRATLPAGAGYDLSAATTFGKIKSDFELTVSPGSREDGRLEGKISGGGCPLRLVNSNGSIEVLRGR